MKGISVPSGISGRDMRMEENMKDEAFRQIHQYSSTMPVLIFRHTKEKSRSVDAHWHDDLEIGLPFKGRIRYYVGGQVRDVTDGKVCLVNSGEVHSTTLLFNGTDKSAPGITVIIQHDFLCSVIPDYDKIMFANPQGEAEEKIAEILFEIAELDRNQGDGKTGVRILGLVCHILYILLDACMIERNSIDINYWRDSERQKIILDYIHANYDQPLRQGELAKMFHFSREYFCRFFKRYTGQTFKEYLTMCRLIHAEQMLRGSSKSIVEIAHCNGFPDEQSFIKAFKEQYQESPGKYRRTGAYDRPKEDDRK